MLIFNSHFLRVIILPNVNPSFASLGVPFVSAIVDTFLKPKLLDLRDKWSHEKALIDHTFENRFADYLKKAYERFSIMNTIALTNKPRELKRLYVPLTVTSSDTIKEQVSFKIDSFLEDFVPSYKKVLITDSAGMGKSTLMRYMFVSCVESNRGIPILIEMRRITGTHKIIDEIFTQLNSINVEFDRSFVLDLIERGDFIFFFDGFDEIALSDQRDAIIDITDFISKANANLFVLTSRPDKIIASFIDFHSFYIQPLEEHESFQLLRNYDNEGLISEGIIRSLRELEPQKSLTEFLSNPLMVSLLFRGYEYKHTIPLRRHIFYRQVYDALFEGHDLQKGDGFVHSKKSELDMEEFHLVVRALGYLTMRSGKVEYDHDELVKFIYDAKGLCPGLSFKAKDIIDDLTVSVPLFYIDGNFFRWTHKAMQDYFSAQYICTDTKGNQAKVLLNMYNSPNIERYITILDLCYDIDYKTFRTSIIKTFSEELIKYYETAYLADQYINIDPSDLRQRRELTAFEKFIIIGIREQNAGIASTLGDLKFWESMFPSWASFANHSLEMFATTDEVMIFRLLSPKVQLVRMLLTKHEPFISRNEFDDSIILSNEFELANSVVISDDPASVLNKPDMFKSTNLLLKRFARFKFSVDKCRETLVVVEREIANDQSTSLFEFP